MVAEKKLAKMEAKLGGTELKLAKAESLNLAQADEISNLKVALDASEEKGYNEGFTDAENSVKSVVHQAWHHGFGEGWLAALQAIGVGEDSPLRNLEQIPYPALPPLVQSQAGGQASAADKEETLSMRELVHAIDTHVEMVDLKVTSKLNVATDVQGQTLITNLPTEDASTRPAEDVIQLPPTDPSV